MKNYIQYIIRKSNHKDFRASIEELVSDLDTNCIRFVVFIGATDNSDYIAKKEICADVISTVFKAEMPLLSVISQQALDCEVVVEIHQVINATIERKNGYIVLESDLLKEIFVSGLCGDVKDSIYEQSLSVFTQMEHILDAEGMKFDDVIRQWNYIERIVHCGEGHQHYQDFNDVRCLYYDKIEWGNGYPAATGIGTQYGGVVIDFNAVQVKNTEINIRPIDNSLQVAAHVYSKDLLIGEKTHKATPKFERAKSISSNEFTTVYISGTAAIRGEFSLTGVGIEKQTEITMENIEQLISCKTFKTYSVGVCENVALRMLRVYIKNAIEVDTAKQFMDKNYTNIPTSYVLGDVCRDELLIEIEGISTN